MLGIPFPDISKLRDGAILVKTHFHYESGSFLCGVTDDSLKSSKGTVYAIEFVSWQEEEILQNFQTDRVPISYVHQFLDHQRSLKVE